MLSLITILYSLPGFIFIALHIVIIIFANRIYNRNSYKYGLTLMMFAVFALVNNIFSVVIQITDLYVFLVIDLGLPYSIANMIMSILTIITSGISLTSMILLVISVIKIYNTHQANRTE